MTFDTLREYPGDNDKTGTIGQKREKTGMASFFSLYEFDFFGRGSAADGPQREEKDMG